MSAAARLEVRGLTLRAGARVLLDGLDLAFGPGERWAILGANGSGKTTLLHVLAGLRAPDAGTVSLDGHDLRRLPARERARRLGILFQDTPPALPATVLQTVLSGRHPHLGFWENEGPDDVARAEAALAAVDLAALSGRSVATLSGGERRRMELAVLLAQDPPLCLLDEPVNHLDPRHQVTLFKLLTERAARPGHLNLCVLHDVNLALHHCSHGLLLPGDGRAIHGRLDAILDAATLEAVYGCPMRELRTDSGRVFIPE